MRVVDAWHLSQSLDICAFSKLSFLTERLAINDRTSLVVGLQSLLVSLTASYNRELGTANTKNLHLELTYYSRVKS